MELAGGATRLVERIVSRSGRTPEEVSRLIEGKKEKFSGLLTDAGAAFMVASELGIETDGAIREETKISQMKEGMNNVDVIGKVRRAFPPKAFEKNGRKGELQNIVISDGTGEIRATLWNNSIRRFAELGAERAAQIKLSNCAVSSYNGVVQVSMNYNSEITIVQAAEAAAPAEKEKPKNISDLAHGMDDVCVEVRIKKIFPAKEWENGRGKGRVMNFIVAEGLQEMRATAWNEAIDAVEEIGEGEKIRIEGAYVKENRGNVELHLGRTARVSKAE